MSDRPDGSADARAGRPPRLHPGARSPATEAGIADESARIMRERLEADRAELAGVVARQAWEADRAAAGRSARADARAEHVAEAERLRASGLSQAQIATRMGADVRTVRRWLAAKK